MKTLSAKITDDEYLQLMKDYQIEQGKIIASGKMATKSSIEDALMSIYSGLDRGMAHEVGNNVECHNLRPIAPKGFDVSKSPLYWQAG